MSYLLDSDTFIAAKNNYYRFTFCPGYWDWILQAHAAGKVFSIDKIRDELARGNKDDDLVKWTKGVPSSFFVGSPSNVSASLSQVANWINSQSYTAAAISIFLSSGDYYLISYAHALGYKVITNETSEPLSKRSVKIPDVCRAVGIDSDNSFQMLEDEGAQLTC